MGIFYNEFSKDYRNRSNHELFSDDELEQFMIESHDYEDEEELFLGLDR